MNEFQLRMTISIHTHKNATNPNWTLGILFKQHAISFISETFDYQSITLWPNSKISWYLMHQRPLILRIDNVLIYQVEVIKNSLGFNLEILLYNWYHIAFGSYWWTMQIWFYGQIMSGLSFWVSMKTVCPLEWFVEHEKTFNWLLYFFAKPKNYYT